MEQSHRHLGVHIGLSGHQVDPLPRGRQRGCRPGRRHERCRPVRRGVRPPASAGLSRAPGLTLSSQDIETLWLAGTLREFDLERLGIDGRVWLRRIADICTDGIRCDDPFFIPAVSCRWWTKR